MVGRFPFASPEETAAFIKAGAAAKGIAFSDPDQITLADLERAAALLRLNNVPAPDGCYYAQVHPSNADVLLLEYDERLTYSDRCLALERRRHEARFGRRPGFHAYDWICARLGIVPIGVG